MNILNQKDLYMARMAISKSIIERGSQWSPEIMDEAREWVDFIMTGKEIVVDEEEGI